MLGCAETLLKASSQDLASAAYWLDMSGGFELVTVGSSGLGFRVYGLGFSGVIVQGSGQLGVPLHDFSLRLYLRVAKLRAP